MLRNIISYIRRRSVGSEEKMFFVQHLALMIRAGISLPKAIEMLAMQTKNRYWMSILDDVRRRLSEGNSLEKCLTKHQKVFGASFISMVGVGELKGDLSSVLDKYFELIQMEEFLKRKIKSALAYPIIVLISMFLLGLVVVLYIFPRIATVFEEANVVLPLPTRIIIGLSNIFIHYGILILISAVLLFALFISWVRTKKGKRIFHSFLLKLPIVSSLIKETNLARLARNLSALLKAGVPISDALSAVSNVLNNVIYRQSVLDAREEIKKGKFLHTAFVKYTDVYPNLIIQIIMVGEEAGALDEVLLELASFYEKKVTAVFESLTSIIEPILIFILGLGVAFMALSILLPIYSISESI